jgi:hypothetical protein
MAAFWEYARESEAIKNAMRDCVDQMTQSKEPGKLYLLRDNQILREKEGLVLFLGYLHFPALSFKEMLDGNLLPEGFRNNPQFGIGGIDLFSSVPKDIGKYSSPPFYLVRIDWTYSNDTLAKIFKDRLRPLRPTDHPERKRPGRRGQTSDLAPIDMLNQLAALRLNRAGSNASEAMEELQRLGSRMLYQPGSAGWRKAIKAAQDRIDRMLEVPFFNPPKRARRKQ